MRISYLLFITLLTILCSCISSKETLEEMQNIEDVRQVYFEAAPMSEEDYLSSRMTIDENVTQMIWFKTDTIGVFPSRGGQVEFVITEDSVTETGFDGGGWGLKNDFEYAAYYPFNFYNRDKTKIPTSYLGQICDGHTEDERGHLMKYMLVVSMPTMVVNDTLRFSVKHIGSILKLSLTMPDEKSYKSLSVYTDSKVIPVRKTVDLTVDALMNQTVTEYSDRLSVDLKNFSSKANEEMVVWMTFPSMSESSHPLSVVVYDDMGNAYTGELKKSDGSRAYASFTRAKWQRRYATLEYNPNFTLGVTTVTPEQWQNGGEYNETVTAP